MNQIQSIQMNIHYTKIELNKARKVICNNEIDKMFIESSIQYYLNELKELKFSLNCAIKQLSYLSEIRHYNN